MTVDHEAWIPDPALAREVSGQFKRAIDSYRIQPNLVVEHANLEESIRTGGYANRTLLELVQNAADAIVGAEDEGETAGRVEIVLDTKNEVLYCANAGRTFSLSGLTAISMAYLSAKRGEEIGRFGLGFKSVLAVSDSPQVFSRSIAFEFNTSEARDELHEVNPAARRLPILRTATVADFSHAVSEDPILADLSSWATTVVRLPGARNLKRLRTEIEGFHSEFLLFVQAVREIRLKVVGGESYEAHHVSRDLGDGRFSIESLGENPDEWIIESRMHAPSTEARKQVGEAVSRSQVKVTVAVPAVQRREFRRGQFWSYFPLQDETSASALFNAPWSVNDDRTTLLKNDYNREILRTVAEMFVDVMPKLSTAKDPAAHLDFMPARGRETLSFGDELLTAHVPEIAAGRELIPNAMGSLRNGQQLLPLDFAVGFDKEVHQAWIQSPNTGDDVPHWLCYQTGTRTTRLRDLYILGRNSEADTRDPRTALTHLPKRGLLTWLREWAEGDDPQSAANALKTVAGHSSLPKINEAKVIPTNAGMRALEDRRVVFLHRESDLEIEEAVFVSPAFLKQHGVEKILQDRGFRDLDPEAILTARLAKLDNDPSPDDLTKVWDSTVDLPSQAATRVMLAAKAPIKVPTLDGGWAWPQQVLDLDVPLGDKFAPRLLDRHRCDSEVAYQLGVVRRPVKDYPIEDEPHFDEYRRWILDELNQHNGPGARPIEAIEFNLAKGPGPFSVLFLMRDVGVPDNARESWTAALLAFGDDPWACEDLETGRTYEVDSPLRWAARSAGLVKSTHGMRGPGDVVAPSLVRYEGLLPLFRGAPQAAAVLELPNELGDVPSHLMREMLEGNLFPPRINDDVLLEFIVAATKVGFEGIKPATIPARIARTIEAHSPNAVYIASTDEQATFLSTRGRPYLRARVDQVDELLRLVGCQRFEDSFAFSEIIEGRQSSEPILDVYTGLRNLVGSDRLNGVTLARAIMIAKRVTTEDGVEDHPQNWYLDGSELVVRDDADETLVLKFINEAFELRLDNAQITSVIKAGIAHMLEDLRIQAKAVDSDAERLELYIGPDDLRDALPKGLWSALEAQGLVSDDTSVAELFLVVYGSDSLNMLKDRFREVGFSDVPEKWAGGASAITWVRKMGFATEYAGQRSQNRPHEFVVPGAVKLNDLHPFQKKISEKLRVVLTQPSKQGPAQKGMVELPTGAGKTRVATQTVLRLFVDEVLSGTILWIAQSIELCEQAVQTFETVWRHLGDERPLTIGRLWENHTVHEPDTEFSVIVATDAKLEAIMGQTEYEWLKTPAAVFVDEAHRAGGSTRYTQILRWLGVDGRSFDRPLVGLSATPFKGSAGETERTQQLAARFGHNRLTAIESDAYKELVGLGVLASVKHEILPGVDVDLSSVDQEKIRFSKVIDRSLYEHLGRNEVRMKILVEHIMELTEEHPDWPILVFTPSVLSAQVLAASLRYREVKADSVSGQTGRQQRRDVISRFQRGEIKVLANCDLLIQGFDAPGVRALYIARPTFSPSAYIQMAGRGLRGPKNGGKEECLIVDVADNWGAMNDFLGYRDYTDLWNHQQGSINEEVESEE
ncbi:DEAD/DEAH box helicase family protein [Nocardioides sp.]|uniref:DEAD/DEAH box helicase n=1 Tax=Nocardioides sp. TaxID=35761 RepID=UPI001988D0CF|nr:DEAD/DEAH box helicase family protein [Nocardioides sp.]MBC7276386.1 DEAD/DEAH box helicase family protein [Nocardioides sp.]